MQYIDLTHTFTSDMPAYPGDPVSELAQISKGEKDGITDHQLQTTMHVGTHIDAPAHMLKGGKLLDAFDVAKFFGRGVLVNASDQSLVGVENLVDVKIKKGDIVVVMTGWYKNFSSIDYFKNYPEISMEFAKETVNLGVKIIGLDTPSPDRVPYEIHKFLLSHGILIIENLTNLQALLNQNFEIIALPAKFQTNAAPCRAVAKIL